MAYISSFMYCDSIQQNPKSKQPEIVRPIQTLSPIAIPSNFSFAVSCNLAGFNPDENNSIRLQFISPSGETIYDTKDIEFKIPEETLQDGKPATMQFNLDLRNLVLDEEGTYSTQVFFNFNQIGEYKIEVRKVMKNGEYSS